MAAFKDTITAHPENITDCIFFGPLSLTTAFGSALLNPALWMKNQMIACGFAAILIAITWYGIRLLRQILNPMKKGEPFSAGSSDKLRTLADFVVIAGIAEQVFTRVTSGMMPEAYDIPRLLNTEVVEKHTLNYTFNLRFAAAAAILFLPVYVFRYGEALQKESDETL